LGKIQDFPGGVGTLLEVSLKPKSKTLVYDLIIAKLGVMLNFGLKLKSKTKLTI